MQDLTLTATGGSGWIVVDLVVGTDVGTIVIGADVVTAAVLHFAIRIALSLAQRASALSISTFRTANSVANTRNDMPSNKPMRASLFIAKLCNVL